MRLIINKEKLEHHLEMVSRVLVSNNAFPVLAGILITASESNIQLVVSNGNLSIKEIVEFDHETRVIDAGRILVNGRLFKDVIKRQSDVVELNVNNNLLQITSSGAKTSMNLLNPDEYPIISFDTFGKELIIDAKELTNVIRDVSFAAAESDKRIILNGVNLQARNGKLIATATNSYRLAEEEIAVNSNVEFNISIFSKNLRDFYPSGVKGELNIKVDDAKIITRYRNSVIVSKLIDGLYPDTSKLIPKEFEATLEISARHLIDLLDKSTVIAEDSTKVVRLSLANNELSIESRRNQIGETLIKTQDFKSDISDYTIAFNAVFVKEALSRFDNNVRIGFTGAFKPFVITGDSKPQLLQLVLPHRTF